MQFDSQSRHVLFLLDNGVGGLDLGVFYSEGIGLRWALDLRPLLPLCVQNSLLAFRVFWLQNSYRDSVSEKTSARACYSVTYEASQSNRCLRRALERQ